MTDAIGWDELERMTPKDMAENPDHWKGVSAPSGEKQEPWFAP